MKSRPVFALLSEEKFVLSFTVTCKLSFLLNRIAVVMIVTHNVLNTGRGDINYKIKEEHQSTSMKL